MTNKHIVVSTVVAVALGLLFGFVAPALISAASTEAVGLGFGLLIVFALAGVITARNYLGSSK